MMPLRPYTPADRDACLAVFDSNAERYFSPGEREMLAAFLDNLPGEYDVVVDGDGRVIGCGGIACDEEGNACLTWGMVHADRHRQGWGKLLTVARLRKLAETPGVRQVRINTSHETEGFYRKLGFVTEKFTADGYRPGLHRHDMVCEVDEALRKRLRNTPHVPIY